MAAMTSRPLPAKKQNQKKKKHQKVGPFLRKCVWPQRALFENTLEKSPCFSVSGSWTGQCIPGRCRVSSKSENGFCPCLCAYQCCR